MTHRTHVPASADERTMLEAYLRQQRDTFRTKTAGLDAGALATRLPPSTLTLGGLLKHMALVEDWWFGVNLHGTEAMEPFGGVDWEADPDWEFTSAAVDPPRDLRDLYERAVAASDAHLARVGDLDQLLHRRHGRTGEGLSLRWMLLHMIEEYARHNGHADLIRESIDGQKGG